MERDQFTIDRAVRGPVAPAAILVVNQANGRDLGNPLPAEDPREVLKPIRRRGAGAEPLARVVAQRAVAELLEREPLGVGRDVLLTLDLAHALTEEPGGVREAPIAEALGRLARALSMLRAIDVVADPPRLAATEQAAHPGHAHPPRCAIRSSRRILDDGLS